MREFKNGVGSVMEQLTDSTVIGPNQFQVSAYEAAGNAQIRINGTNKTDPVANWQFEVTETVEGGGGE
jgi:hypothetical protein